VDQILAEEEVDGGTADLVAWTLTDYLNTVRDIAKYDPQTGSTTVVNHLVYDAFGKMTSESNPAVDSLFLFTARPLDADTGLQNNLNRWYDPAVGRWLSEEVVGWVLCTHAHWDRGHEKRTARGVALGPVRSASNSAIRASNRRMMAWDCGGWRAMISSVTAASMPTVVPQKPYSRPDPFFKKTSPGCERLPCPFPARSTAGPPTPTPGTSRPWARTATSGGPASRSPVSAFSGPPGPATGRRCRRALSD